MTDDDTIKRYASEHPFELIADKKLFGKDYRLNDMPEDASGNVLYKGDSEFEYMAYVKWLADYLYKQEIEPDERQWDLCRVVSRMPEDDSMRFLGMYGAIHDSFLVDCDALSAIYERINEPGSFSEEDIEWIYSRTMEIRKEYEEWASSNDTNSIPIIVAAEDLSEGVTRETIRQYLLEEAEREGLLNREVPDFPDVAWRIPLSVVLKNVTDKKERFRLLEIFFKFHAEYALK